MPTPASRLPAHVSRPTEVVGEISLQSATTFVAHAFTTTARVPLKKTYLYEVYEGNEVSELDERHPIGFFYSIPSERVCCCHEARAQ